MWRKKEIWGLAVGLIMGLLVTSPLTAKGLTVAVFNFESEDVTPSDIGSKISKLLSVQLSQEKEIQLVEREKLDEIFKELGLSLSGVISEDQVLKVGSLAGAKVLVLGHAFMADKELIITSKVVGTETSRVKSVMVKASLSDNLSEVISKLGKKIIDVLEKYGKELVAKPTKKEDLAKGIKNKIKGQSLPTIVVVIDEEHTRGRIIDPAAKTETILIFKECGFEIQEEGSELISDWARDYLKGSGQAIPTGYKADIIVIGEALSGFAGRRGDLVSCQGRVEMRGIDRRTKRVIAVGRVTQTAVGLSEEITAKTALQEATEKLLGDFIPKLVSNWSKLHK